MEILKAVLFIGLFVSVVALLLWIFEKIAKIFGSKLVLLSLVVVIPAALGLLVIAFNFQNLTWFEIVSYPFIGPLIVMSAIFLGAVAINPEIICIPFIVLHEYFKKKNRP